ncbi:ABC-type nitrate/sulfonate/bicarbonate transport system, permease component [Burkholderia sp. Ch1-1]|uniref:ABC-type nitrate/sulfonate/bicarbonate transport system, permease component n=1 Tax=Paraburkholderia dioscoreae TaxID=2604047 RepID=A0A5Q4ZPK3_9BURK|nr:ABC transporter permease [Paraburkholderia dioscoreae]EIF35051.1 ABC-type nitrate/sulfonate/bicarbonate transport system, permease component [Burkholderia sp. Ch1-1]VVD34248.1 ABC-type nitrate/sulfonate/bicarbonate transport system, permease component [Paraburkholderia dioscoreae]
MSTIVVAHTVRPRHTRRWLDGVVLIVVLAVLWQVLSEMLGPDAITTPWRTLERAVHIVSDPDFPASLYVTAFAFGSAFLISAIGGVCLGMLLGARKLAGDVMEPLMMGFYSIPKVTLYPVVLLAFGLGLWAKIVFGVMHGIVPITIFTMNAVRNMPPIYTRAARTYRLSPFALARHVLLPACVPEVVAGLRIGFSLTLLGTLIGEMFASQSGIGHMLMIAMNRSETSTIMALALMLFVFATLVNLLLLAWQRHLTHST